MNPDPTERRVHISHATPPGSRAPRTRIWRARVLSIAACCVSYFMGKLSSTPDAIAIKIYNEQTKTAERTNSSSSLRDNVVSGSFSPVYVYANETPPPVARYSQVNQDMVVMRLIEAHVKKGGATNKFFVDLASNDATYLSNTMRLEQEGWDGVCIEGNPQYWYRLAALRKCRVIGAFVGGTVDGVQVDVTMSNTVFGGIVGEGFDNAGKKAEEKRNLVTIATVFKEMDVPIVVDYLSLDVEGAEFFVMKDFPFDTHTVRFMTIERPTMELMSLLDLHGYKQNPMDFVDFGETLWFHPNATLLSAKEVDKISDLKIPREKCGWRGMGGNFQVIPNRDCT